MFNNIYRWNKINIRWMLVVYDFIIFAFSVSIFFVLFTGGGILQPLGMVEHSLLAFCCIFLMRFITGIYQQIWRYGGIQCYLRFLASDTIACLVYMILDLILPVQTIAMSRIMSVCGINMFGALTIRMIYRYCYKCGQGDSNWEKFLNTLLKVFAGKEIAEQKKKDRNSKKIAIIGAGRVGVSLAEELISNPEASYKPVCFVDTNTTKAGREIHSIPVLSSIEATKEMFRKLGVEEVVFTLPANDTEKKKKLYEHYKYMDIPVKIYDYPVMANAGTKRQLRSFEIEEVLFRTPVVVLDDVVCGYYADKVILVTGGGGSIGSELSRQVAKMKPKQLILLDIYENGVYDVQQELKMIYGHALCLEVEIVSITDRDGLDTVFSKYHPQIVINAAAHKHVPLMEKNCIEAVKNNVFGTLNVIELCEAYSVERFIMLSTDKAVNPTNVMGTTKRICEMMIQAYSAFGNVKYSATRFGNVLGSAGSVIPLFKRQIANGGPITITDRRIIRYFMTIPEASQLVLKSGAMASNGQLFVLDMGEPVKILDLAENMISLSGLKPYKDIDIIETGLRPGEKLYEELLVKGDELERTSDNMIFVESEQPITMEELNRKLTLLKLACESRNDGRVKAVLHEVVPTYRKPEEVNL